MPSLAGTQARAGFNLPVSEEQLRAATIPEILEYLPLPNKQASTPRKIRSYYEKKFLADWRKAATKWFLAEEAAVEFVQAFGVAPDQEIATALLENTVPTEDYTAYHGDKFSFNDVPFLTQVRHGDNISYMGIRHSSQGGSQGYVAIKYFYGP